MRANVLVGRSWVRESSHGMLVTLTGEAVKLAARVMQKAPVVDRPFNTLCDWMMRVRTDVQRHA